MKNMLFLLIIMQSLSVFSKTEVKFIPLADKTEIVAMRRSDGQGLVVVFGENKKEKGKLCFQRIGLSKQVKNVGSLLGRVDLDEPLWQVGMSEEEHADGFVWDDKGCLYYVKTAVPEGDIQELKVVRMCPEKLGIKVKKWKLGAKKYARYLLNCSNCSSVPVFLNGLRWYKGRIWGFGDAHWSSDRIIMGCAGFYVKPVKNRLKSRSYTYDQKLNSRLFAANCVIQDLLPGKGRPFVVGLASNLGSEDYDFVPVIGFGGKKLKNIGKLNGFDWVKGLIKQGKAVMFAGFADPRLFIFTVKGKKVTAKGTDVGQDTNTKWIGWAGNRALVFTFKKQASVLLCEALGGTCLRIRLSITPSRWTSPIKTDAGYVIGVSSKDKSGLLLIKDFNK